MSESHANTNSTVTDNLYLPTNLLSGDNPQDDTTFAIRTVACTDCCITVPTTNHQTCQECHRPLCPNCYLKAIRIASEVTSRHHHICDTCGWYEIG